MSRYFPANQPTRLWAALKKGDIVDIVAPASACKLSELNGAIRFLKSKGLKPRVHRDIFMRKPTLFAQTDEVRFAQLKQALLAKDSKAVWCVRGGYGALRLLPMMQKLAVPKTAKVFIGYSDITTLHAFLNSHWRWPTMHGPLLDRFGRGANLPRETKETFGMLFGTRQKIVFDGLKPLNAAARAKRKIKGKVVGGNIAVIQSGLGTPWQVSPNGHFVFLEDTGERPHRLDRMLTQMTQAGYFKRARAVIFGPLLVAETKDKRLIWDEVIPRFAKAMKIPVFTGLTSGHGRIQRPLPLMTTSVLETGAEGRLTVSSGARA